MQQRARHLRLSWLATIIAIAVLLLFGVLSARAQGSASTSAASSQGQASPAFTVSFGPGVQSTPVTGRLSSSSLAPPIPPRVCRPTMAV